MHLFSPSLTFSCHIIVNAPVNMGDNGLFDEGGKQLGEI
jgi:hypothetical protein